MIILEHLALLFEIIHHGLQCFVLVRQRVVFFFARLRNLSRAAKVLISCLELIGQFFVVFLSVSMVLAEVFHFLAQLVKLLLIGLVLVLGSCHSILIKFNSVFVFVHGQAASVYLKVLVLELALVLRLEPVQVLGMLLLKLDLEVLDF